MDFPPSSHWTCCNTNSSTQIMHNVTSRWQRWNKNDQKRCTYRFLPIHGLYPLLPIGLREGLQGYCPWPETQHQITAEGGGTGCAYNVNCNSHAVQFLFITMPMLFPWLQFTGCLAKPCLTVPNRSAYLSLVSISKQKRLSIDSDFLLMQDFSLNSVVPCRKSTGLHHVYAAPKPGCTGNTTFNPI